MRSFPRHLALLLFAIILCTPGFSASSTDTAILPGLDEKAVLELAARANDPKAQMQAGWFYLAQQWDGKKAQVYLEKALALDSDCAMAYAGLGLYYELMGDQSRAIYNYALAAQSQPDWAMGGAMLHRAAQLVPINSAEDFLAQTCQTIMDSPGVDSRLQDFATYLLASTLLEKGDRTASQEMLHELGFIDKWQILGPIPAEGRSSLTPIPEIESYPLAFNSVSIANAEFRWRLLPFGIENGEVPLNELLSPNDASAAYAATLVEMESTTRVHLLFGGPGLDRMWIDGNLVLSEDDERAVRPDQVARELTLTKGIHFILVKTACREADGDLNFTLRFTDIYGRRIIPSTNTDLANLRSAQSLTLADTLNITPANAPWDFAIEPEQYDPLLYFWKGNLVERFQPSDTSTNLAWQLMNQALVQLPGFIPGHMAAGWSSNLADRQDMEYDLVLNQEPTALGALLLKAKNMHNRRQQDNALNLFFKIKQVMPNNIEAVYYMAYIFYEKGLWDRVQTVLHECPASFKDIYYLQYLNALAALQINPKAKSFDDYLTTMSLNPTHGYYRLRLVELLQSWGETEHALELIRNGILLSPYDQHLYIALVETLWGADKGAAALEEAAKALAIFPDSPRLNELMGLMLEKAGEVEAARKYYRKVLDVSPQNQMVSARLDRLNPPQDDYYRPYRITAEELADAPVAADMLETAQALVLLNQEVRRINRDGTSRITRHLIVKVLDEEGAQLNNTQGILFSPDLDELKIFNARVISPDGTEWTSTSYYDRSVSDPNRKLFYNYIYRIYYFPHVSSGMIIDFEYALESGAEKLYGGAFADYHLFGSQYPTHHSEYTVIAPKAVRFFEKGYRGAPSPQAIERTDGSEIIHRYVLKDIPAVPIEDSSPPLSEILPEIRISSFASWEQIGRWYWGLARDRIKSTAELDELCRNLIAAGSSKSEVVFHDYVTNRIRYVGLELGISGYQPRYVADIFSSRYGDCKDKAVLLVTMLKNIGQKAYITLLATNNSSFVLDPEFPTIGIFNHAIAAVPEGRDGLHFTDPTAEYNGLDELPWADQGVWALIIDDENYRLVKTPEYRSQENTDVANTDIFLNSDGSAYGHRSLSYGPINSPFQRERFSQPVARQNLLEEFWSYFWAGTSLSNLAFSDTSNLAEPVSISYDLKIPHFTYPSGGFMRLPLTLFPRSPGQKWAGATGRKLPLLLGAPNRIVDNLTYHLPEGAIVERIPDTIELLTSFGAFQINISVEGLTIKIEYVLQIDAVTIQPQDYLEFRQAMLDIDKAETDRILVRMSQ